MRALMITAGTLIFATGFVAGGRLEPPVGAQGFTVVMDCGASSAPQLRTTLYFGLARPKGAVTELEWQLFLRDEVTSRFPGGLTVWEAEGQWRTPAGSIDHEQSKVLLLVHPDTAEARQSVLAYEARRSAGGLPVGALRQRRHGLTTEKQRSTARSDRCRLELVGGRRNAHESQWPTG